MSKIREEGNKERQQYEDKPTMVIKERTKIKGKRRLVRE
jgi:hypothetical protein